MMMGFGLLIPLLILGVIIYALGWRPQIGNYSLPNTSQSRSALDVLNERYARGEISREEYQVMRDDLSS